MRLRTKFYKEEYARRSVSLFKDREECATYLTREVFNKTEFINHIVETAESTEVEYEVAYSVITNNLIDTMYEIDKSISRTKSKKRILIHGFFSLDIGFMESVKNGKILLLKSFKFKKDE